MVDVDSVLDDPGLNNGPVPEFVRYWADVTGAEQVDVDDASGYTRLIRQALEAGEILPAGSGRYYPRSYIKDFARSEARTVVATNKPATTTAPLLRGDTEATALPVQRMTLVVNDGCDRVPARRALPGLCP
jgi:GTP-dependent phosphoenolpyruvate carboxykinase